MKFMHIFPDSIFLSPFLAMLKEHLPEHFSDSYFFVSGEKYPPTARCNQLTVVRSRVSLLKKYFGFLRFDRFVWHSFNLYDRELILLSLIPWIPQRSTWVIWGADLYNGVEVLQADHSFKGRIRWCLFRYLASRLGTVATLLPGDYEYARHALSVRGRWLQAIYPVSTPAPQVHATKQWPRAEPLRILVGNSASRTNRHEDILQRLTAYKDQDFEVVVPLSYGDTGYANEVCRQGEFLFGPKFKPLLNWQSPEDYAALLDSVDVGIFNYKRQQGLGNIFYLIQAGKRVFVRRDSPMWPFLTNDLGIDVGDACLVGSISFEAFHLPVNAMQNHARMSAFCGTENVVRTWRAILTGRGTGIGSA